MTFFGAAGNDQGMQAFEHVFPAACTRRPPRSTSLLLGVLFFGLGIVGLLATFLG